MWLDSLPLALGVPQFNEGTRRLYERWRPVKLPTGAPGKKLVPISLKKLRRMRLAAGLTLKEVATRCGWTSSNTYQQLEAGRRERVTAETL